MSRLAYVSFAAVFALASCKEQSSNYCPNNPHQNCMNDAAIDGTGACTGDQDCSAPTSVCDLGVTKTCVQCTTSESSACTGTTPVCGSDDTCHACKAHGDCSSAACLPDGSCGTEMNVAYVDPSGTANAMCTKAMPCSTVAAALATNRPFVKFHGTTTEQVTVNNESVTWLADSGATLTETTSGVIVQVTGTSTLTIYDLTIADALGSTGAGISLPAGNSATLALKRATVTGGGGVGIMCTGGTLTVSQSTISANTGGGISMTGAGTAFDISNNFIYRNGNTVSASVGGISAIPSSGSKLEFNTIVDNQANAGAASAGAVFCDQSGFIASDNLIFRNTGGTAGNVQTFGNCTYGNSYVQPGSSTVDNTPMFAHPNTTPFDYHLTASTPNTILDAAGACTGTDFDGDTRPIGVACDLGADEYKP